MTSKTKTPIPEHIRPVVERVLEEWDRTTSIDYDFWGGDDAYDVNIYQNEWDSIWRVAVYARVPDTGEFDYGHVVWAEDLEP